MSDTFLLEWEDLVIDFINRGFSKPDARTRATEIMEERYNKFTSEDDVLE
jgi:hypothetical protein